ncbi:MAG: hypothetical protein ACE5JG_03275, partial [Planctomycetota bacterium]
PPEWFEEQLAAARREAEEGKLAEAQRRLDRARRRRPRRVAAQRIRELIGVVNRKVLELPTLEAQLQAVDDPIVVGEPVRLRLQLRNVSGRVVRIPARLRRTSGTVLVFDVERREYDINAQMVVTRHPLRKRLERDLVVGARGTVWREFTLEQARNERPVQGFRIFTIRGTLRPAVVEVGELRRWEAVDLGAARLRVFRPNYEHLADDPVRRIGQALDKDARVHLLTACALVPPQRRRAAVDLLVARLQRNRGIDLTIYGCLHYLTGVSLGRDAEAWRAWWRRVGEGYFEPLPERPDPEAPTFGKD